MTNTAKPFPDSCAAAEWRGLAIGVDERDGGFVYRVRMVHDDQATATVIVQTPDEQEAIVAWRYWSASLRLPRLVEKAPGLYHALETRFGALLVRPRSARRRGSPLASRRPRRLALRNTGRRHGLSVISGEREIIARS
ncbi:MAG: hypothetical protein KGM42_16985 [Hyphomicrobiales bacterium]|nr:hypothetical protein [Hyphomicrobiales bacterium]